ncbi:MAG: hypothetical protein EP329_21940 [Deltaproteobacteria bacterium]|nr:MAG: hypothetical protein EP329_21940 [Deltaproteobacteria bacterium]
MKRRATRLWVALIVCASAPGAVAAEPPPSDADGRPDEDALFGGAGGEDDARPDEDALFGGGDDNATPSTSGDGRPSEDSIFGGGPVMAPPAGAGQAGSGDLLEDPLSIGGQLYLRLAGQIYDRGSAGSQALSMPNLLDLYLDARPEERVRGFFSGRLYYDPTIADGDTDALGNPRGKARVLVDQLWIKTDIARSVFVTLGQERIKWGASRIWNPTDFVNATFRDPLAIFDERTGVPMLKLLIPVDTWNFYLIGLLGGASRFDEPGVAFRIEKAFSASEVSLSGTAGKGRRTAFGADLSTALGPFDLTAEVAVSDERDTLQYSGTFSFDPITLPDSEAYGKWAARFSAGLQYAFKPNDDDVQYLGVEYFYNPLGADDPDLYPWLLMSGDFLPFYLGQHYLALVWAVPGPGDWDEATFSLSNIGNLSDRTFVTRLDFSVVLHTRLRLEAYAQAHYGQRGGELRFALDVPDLPAIPGVLPDGVDAFSVPAPAVLLGLNLRISI